MSMNLIYKGSTKDVYQNGEDLVFNFSDRYSVFDWGEMPDLIPNKGISLGIFTKKIFSHFSKIGIKNHFIESLNDNEIRVKKFNVIQNKLSEKLENTFIPLEFIFRLGVSKGSSVLKRFTSLEEWKNAGLDRIYYEGEKFNSISIEYTTKHEPIDRFLNEHEAKSNAGANDIEWQNIKTKIRQIAIALDEIFKKLGIDLWDGKCELAFGKFDKNGNREIILVDSIGPDEMRLTKNEIQLSKEVLRQYYINTNWYENLRKSKLVDNKQFKKICTSHYQSNPQHLPSNLCVNTSKLYQLLAEIVLVENKELNESNKMRLNNLIDEMKRDLQ